MNRLASFVLFAGLSLLPTVPLAAGNWPQWRGPDGTGVSAETELPLHWDEKTHVAWKAPLPGQGASTPAVWGAALFVTAQDGEALLLLRLDARTGKIAWSRRVGSGTPRRAAMKRGGPGRGQQKFHNLHNLASPSPVTDGEVVIAHFGNGDLAAYDFAGRQLWHHNLATEHGSYTIWWGHANSPVLYRDLVVSVCMQDSLSDLGGGTALSYLVAHDRRTGKRAWLTPRPTRARAEECDSYTTPVLRHAAGRDELVVMGANQLDAYDPATGKQLWFLPGLRGGRTITGLTVAGDLVYATRGMRGDLLCVRPTGTGELPPEAIVWKHSGGTPDSSCPVVWAGLLFWVSDNGIAHCCDARTGELKWKERLPGDYKPSPVAAAGRVYFLNRTGTCTVVAAEPRYRTLAVNRLPADTVASPAPAHGRIYLRGRDALYCIGTPPSTP